MQYKSKVFVIFWQQDFRLHSVKYIFAFGRQFCELNLNLNAFVSANDQVLWTAFIRLKQGINDMFVQQDGSVDLSWDTQTSKAWVKNKMLWVSK